MVRILSPTPAAAMHTDGARRGPLHAHHEALGAAFVDVDGWRMPGRYADVADEQRAVRSGAGLFDLSHLAVTIIDGDEESALVRFARSSGLNEPRRGRTQRALMLARNGGILADARVLRVDARRFAMISRAAENEPLRAWLHGRSQGTGGSIRVHDGKGRVIALSVDGPRAEDAFAAGRDRIVKTALASSADAVLSAARTRHTGEHGLLMLIDTERAPEVWTEILRAGHPLGLVPAGLIARDGLRVEAGVPRAGRELALDVVPRQLGLAHVAAVSDDRGQAASGSIDSLRSPVLVGLVLRVDALVQERQPVFDARALRVGEVTSAAWSSELDHPIAMALVAPECAAPGTRLLVGDDAHVAAVSSLPFFRREK